MGASSPARARAAPRRATPRQSKESAGQASSALVGSSEFARVRVLPPTVRVLVRVCVCSCEGACVLVRGRLCALCEGGSHDDRDDRLGAVRGDRHQRRKVALEGQLRAPSGVAHRHMDMAWGVQWLDDMQCGLPKPGLGTRHTRREAMRAPP
eukprot:316540-Prymnesium_polylepis.1